MAKLGDPSHFITIEFPDKVNVRIDMMIPTIKNQQVYEVLGTAVRASLTTADPKATLLDFFKKFKINDKVKDLDFRKHKFALEPDTITVYNEKTSETIVMIKTLRDILTEEVVKKYEQLKSGVDGVVENEIGKIEEKTP